MAESTGFDVVLAGAVFFDIVFTGLDGAPTAGIETFADGMGTSPGGIANMAVAISRLGLRTALATVLGDDAYGRWTWHILNREGVDLTYSCRIPDRHTSVTVSLIQGGDRAMVTHGHADPLSPEDLLCAPVPSRAAFIDLHSLGPGADAWWRRARRGGARIFASTGWDSTGEWNLADLDPLRDCDVFYVNEGEALNYSRAATVEQAALWLAERVPVAVVTCGPAGALAASGDELVAVPAVPTTVLDATGAGDVFAAAFLVGTLDEWPLAQRLAFAALCAGLAVGNFGGAMGSPGWSDLATWWQHTQAVGDPDLVHRYAFLEDLLAAADLRAVARAEATPTLAGTTHPAPPPIPKPLRP